MHNHYLRLSSIQPPVINHLIYDIYQFHHPLSIYGWISAKSFSLLLPGSIHL